MNKTMLAAHRFLSQTSRNSSRRHLRSAKSFLAPFSPPSSSNTVKAFHTNSQRILTQKATLEPTTTAESVSIQPEQVINLHVADETAVSALKNSANPISSVAAAAVEKLTAHNFPFTSSDYARFVLVGLAGGTFGSLVGLGGNVVLIPLMSSLLSYITQQRAKTADQQRNHGGSGDGQQTGESSSFHFTQKQINATCLVCVVASGLVGSVTLYRLSQEDSQREKATTTLSLSDDNGEANVVGGSSTNKATKAPNVDWFAATVIGTMASITAPIAAKMANHSVSDYKLKMIMACFMLVVAPATPFLKDAINHYNSNVRHSMVEQQSTPPSSLVTKDLMMRLPFALDKSTFTYAGIGCTIGLMTGLLGVGGGMFMIPALSLLWASHADKNQKTVIGTSLASMIVPSAIACFTHYRLGNVVTRIAPFLVMGAMMGGMTGGYLSGKVLDEETLKYVFAVTVFVLGVSQFRKARLLRPKSIATGVTNATGTILKK